MVTFNQVLSGSDVNTQEHTQVMFRSIIYGINTLHVHVTHLWPDSLSLGG